MNAHTPLRSSPEDDRAGRVLDRQLVLLDRLADIGMQIAETIGRQVAADAESPDEALDQPGRRAQVLNTSAMAYARAARAVRMSLALQSRLLEGPKHKGEPAESKPETIRYAWVTEQLPPHHKRRQVHDGLKRAVWDAHLDFEALERLADEAAERLEDGLYEEVMDRPVEEIVAMICRDLGVVCPPPVDWAAPSPAGGLAGSVSPAPPDPAPPDPVPPDHGPAPVPFHGSS
jgi:hypothetical protein